MATITTTTDRERERLRRSALARPQGPTAEQQAYAYSRNSALQLLGDPQDPTNVSFPFLRRMRRDHMVAMGLHFIAMPIVRAPWYFEADDARVASFADNLIRPIYGRLVLTVLRMLWAGYSPAVKNFETINPAWTYLPGIGEDPKRVWDQGNIQALVYKPVTPLKPENCQPSFDSTGRFNGIRYDNLYGGAGHFVIDGQKTPDIDLLHSVWAAHDIESEDGSPYGFPRIAHCAPIFHMYRYIWTLLGRAFENNADPGPVVRFPRDEGTEVDSEGNVIKNVDLALLVGRRKRSGSTVALPSDPYLDLQEKPTNLQKWGLEYPKSETSFGDIQEFLGFLESAKLRALFLQEQGLITASGSQSNRNVMENAGEQRDDSQIVLINQVIETVEEFFVKPAIAMNMPWYQGSLTMKSVGFGTQEDEAVRQILQLAGQEDWRSFGVDVRRTLEAKGLPMLSPADYKKVQEEAAQKPTAPPEVKPTQGRRALVTQTGYDREHSQPEMSYVQLGDSIDLSTDGDFVASLPRTDVFSDSKVLSATRSLRSESKVFLAWAYADFARYLGKQKSLDLQDLLSEAESGDGVDLDRASSRIATQIMLGWKMKAERVEGFSQKVRSVLGRVYDRTAGMHLERLGSSTRTTSADKVAAAWLDEQGADLVSGVLETTRRQLADVLAEGVREGKNQRQIAKDIRERFEDIPDARAATIARTEVSAAYNYATASAGMAAGLKMGQLIDGNEDAPCKERNGRIVSLSDAISEKLNHPNAVLAGTTISSMSPILAMNRARWEGPCVEITTVSGARLAVGPNHPVLTDQGWIAADQVCQGHKVVNGGVRDLSGVTPVEANLHQNSARVENLFTAISHRGPLSRRVPSANDFHGDGNFCEGEVDVVLVDRLLGLVGDRALIQRGGQTLFVAASDLTASFPGLRVEHQRLDALLAATKRRVGGSRAARVGIAGADLYALSLEHSYEGRVADGELLLDLDERLASSVGGNDLLHLGSAPSSRLVDPGELQAAEESNLADACLSGKGLTTLARSVALDEVAKVNFVPHISTHAYDLQTTDLVYWASGIMVHNCTLLIRLLPRAPEVLEVRYEALDGLHARYDQDTATVLFDPDISPEDETDYMLALGDALA